MYPCQGYRIPIVEPFVEALAGLLSTFHPMLFAMSSPPLQKQLLDHNVAKLYIRAFTQLVSRQQHTLCEHAASFNMSLRMMLLGVYIPIYFKGEQVFLQGMHVVR